VIATVDFDDADGQGRAADEEDLETLRARALTAEEEVTVLRRRLQESPRRVQTLEEKLLETKGQLAQAVSQNEKLTFTLQTAKEHVANLRDEVEKLTQPPSSNSFSTTTSPCPRCASRSTRTSTPPNSTAATRSCSTSRST
jgi:uncharacterized protein (DUF342 family)